MTSLTFSIKKYSVILLLIFTAVPLFGSAEQLPEQKITSDATISWSFSSGPLQNQMVELFTSEGCSSCPPADRWLSSLKDSPELWHNLIPIAFHVDYWNSLGWADPFSSRAYSLRQRIYRDQLYINSVYTPGFVVNGSEWRGWFSRNPIPKKTHKEVGELSLEINKLRDKVSFNAGFMRPGSPNTKIYRSSSSDQFTLNIALLAMNQKTNVKLGENRGKILHHDFVVTNLQSLPYSLPSIVDEENQPLSWQGELDLSLCQDCAIAAWINQTGDQQPIQAIGGYLK